MTKLDRRLPRSIAGLLALFAVGGVACLGAVRASVRCEKNIMEKTILVLHAESIMDALLTQRVAIATQLRDLVAPLAEAVGVKIHAAEVRDVMLPGELRKAFSETLKAKQEGQAALERARGESAALRNLANAARLIESQPALATLRFLQILGNANANQMLVMNDMSAFAPAAKARGNARAAPESTET